MGEAEKERLIEIMGSMGEEELAVAASVIPSRILLGVIAQRMEEIEGKILGVIGALEEKRAPREGREIEVIGGIWNGR